MARTRSPAKLWINEEIRAGRRRAVPMMMLGAGGTALGLAQIFCAARLLAAMLHPQRQPILPFALGFAAAAVFRALLMVRQEKTGITLGIAARRRLRSGALTRLLAMGPGGLRGRHSAGLAAIVVDQIEALDGLFARWIAAAALASLSPLLIVIVALFIDRSTGLILAATGILVPVAMAVAGLGAGAASRRQFTAMSRLQTRFVDRIRGIATIVLAGRAEDEAKALGQAADELRRRTLRILRVAFLSSTALDLAAAAALILIAIRFAPPLIATHGAIAPQALFALLLVPEFFAPLRAFAAVYQDRMAAQTVAEDLVALQSPVPAAVSAPAIRTVSAQGVAVAFEQVGFAWDAQRGKVLDDLSFRLPAGETMMLVGPSGSGKSTIIELLLGFIAPQSGRITINGAPIESIVPEALAGLTAVISQRPFLFSGTIEENIRLGRADATPAAVLEAAKRARLTAFTDSLPDRLGTRIGEGGYGLSGGQAQRVAIARAFLKDAKLLLLDEPTAQLDPATERDVLDSLKRLAIGRTVILASHAAFAHEFSGRKLDLGVAAREASLQGAA